MTLATLVRPEEAAADWTIPQRWADYSAQDHATWDALFDRQVRLLPGRVAPEFLDGLDMLRLSNRGIPDFDELSDRLMRATGWQVVAVPGLVPDEVFFDHLANRRFVVGQFHPATAPARLSRRNPTSSTMCSATCPCSPIPCSPITCRPMAGAASARRRWGRSTGCRGSIGTRSSSGWYGRGTRSGFSAPGSSRPSRKSSFALDDPSPNRIGFDLKRVMRTTYRIDDFQQNYFVIDSFEDLLDQTLTTDFGAALRRARRRAPISTSMRFCPAIGSSRAARRTMPADARHKGARLSLIQPGDWGSPARPCSTDRRR